MTAFYFVSHPEVSIDAKVPVPRWSLTDLGIARMRKFAAHPALTSTAAVWASTETKAIEGAGIVAAHFGLPIRVDAGLDENDRSGTGFLPPDEFDRTADRFFASPKDSVRGWERAIDAQARIVQAFERIVGCEVGGDIVVVGHGGTGTLLYCHLAGVAIDRSFDQPGPGNCWSLDRQSRRMRHGWRPLEAFWDAA